MRAQRHFYELGFDVFLPTDNKTRADLVVVEPDSGVPYRVQVKTVQENCVGTQTYLQARLSSSDNDRTYTKECCDLLVFVYGERIWVAPIEEVAGLKSVCLDRISDEGLPYRRKVAYDPTKWEVQN